MTSLYCKFKQARASQDDTFVKWTLYAAVLFRSNSRAHYLHIYSKFKLRVGSRGKTLLRESIA